VAGMIYKLQVSRYALSDPIS